MNKENKTQYRYGFYLTWFTAFLIFWGIALFTKPENRMFSGFMFIGHIFMVALYLKIFVDNINNK